MLESVMETLMTLGCQIRDNGLVEIWDGVYKTRMNKSELIQFGAVALDSSTIAT